MKNDFTKIFMGVFVLGSIVCAVSYARAEGDTKVSATIVPLEYISVKGHD